ncbi:trafficking regulator of GLUT4 1-like [Podarcis lilfordi]|uniref:Trafficking regulator of GLUT4 1-like n=1 Tax=Podarcis lilfordi TaxID=74358 RepID=A0AA35KPI1_9SAUR|nr:trafficking regulator of GLUT4 1-like [Podarcis lilfordi]
MSDIKYERMNENALHMDNPPPYSAKNEEPGPSAGMAPTTGSRGTPAMPHQYTPYYGPASIAQTSQTIVISSVQPSREPDYMAYSIFTMLCCCLPLGVAALAYSIQTQNANQNGNYISARRNSRVALILAHTALGVGLGCLIIYIIFWMNISHQIIEVPTISP